MSDNKYNYKSCLECNGEGFIIATYSRSIHSLFIVTVQEPRLTANQKQKKHF